MATLKVRYFVCRKEKSGKERFYWQPDTVLRKAGWKMFRLADDRAAAITQAEEKNAEVDAWRAKLIDGPQNEKPGTIDAVIAKYKKSRFYKERAPKTRKEYDRYLRYISDWAGDVQAVAINAKMCQDLYETLRVKKARTAKFLLQVLGIIFAFAERESMIPRNTNPAVRMRIDYKAEKGTLWPEEAVGHFVRTADAMGYSSIGTAIMLNTWLGQRRADLIRLSMANYRNGCFHIRQSKTKAELALPVDSVPELKARLDLQLKWNKERKSRMTSMVLIQQQGGKAYTDEGFKTGFERVRIEAAKEMPLCADLVFKDLRHTAVTRLAEAGVDVPQIAAVTGHTFKSAQAILDTYNITTTKMAREAFARRLQSEQQ